MEASSQQKIEQPSKVTVEKNGTVHVPAYDIPLSSYMSNEARQAYISQSHTPPLSLRLSDDIAKYREAVDRVLLAPMLQRAKASYPVVIEEKEIGGVRTYIIIPKSGISEQNEHRVLVNLHGGGFSLGAGSLQLIESIPIAATAKIKVVSVDYRLAPEHKFPAASEDVAAVYKVLLTQYRPQNIGIYGHSVGGGLVEMSMAWFQEKRLPIPGAIGVFSAANVLSGGDSRYVVAPLNPLFGGNSVAPPAAPNPPPPPLAIEYFAGVNLKDRLVLPELYPEVLSQFPPTLLITGTRDFLASSVINSHRQLVKAGVEAELHVWDGMWHGFIQDVDLPESKEMYSIAAKFFNRHLGTLTYSRE